MALFKFKFPEMHPPGTPQMNLATRGIHLAQALPKTIWAIGGGKGGIGKTLLTSNIAVYLSWLNKRVVVIDMDLGGANLHTSLGVTTPKSTLSDLLLGHVEKVEDLLHPTPIRNVSMISGAHDPLTIANLPNIQKSRLMRKLREIPADFILLDLGAGTSHNTLDFFLLADEKIIVITPEPTSIENAYRFIKAAFYRMLRASTPSPHIRSLVEQIMDNKSLKGIETPKDLLREVKRLAPEEGALLEERMQSFHLSLILNQVRIKSEAEIGKSVQMVSERYFGIKVDYAGYLPYDNSVWQSIRKRVPFLMDSPNSTAVTHLEEMVRNILKKYVKKT